MDPGRGTFRIPVAREGWPLILVPVVAAVIVLALGWTWAAVALGVIALAVAAFFRDPERSVPRDSSLVVSPADGKVTHVQTLDDGTLRISIFLSVFDVHLNRAPVAGEVSRVRYRPGKLLPANFEKSSQDNEQNEVWIEGSRGPVRVVQIAGIIARRIVCRVRPGEAVALGQRFGMIRFGSRTDVYLPPGAEAAVQVGSRCRAGETVVARWQEPGS